MLTKRKLLKKINSLETSTSLMHETDKLISNYLEAISDYVLKQNEQISKLSELISKLEKTKKSKK